MPVLVETYRPHRQPCPNLIGCRHKKYLIQKPGLHSVGRPYRLGFSGEVHACATNQPGSVQCMQDSDGMCFETIRQTQTLWQTIQTKEAVLTAEE